MQICKFSPKDYVTILCCLYLMCDPVGKRIRKQSTTKILINIHLLQVNTKLPRHFFFKVCWCQGFLHYTVSWEILPMFVFSFSAECKSSFSSCWSVLHCASLITFITQKHRISVTISESRFGIQTLKAWNILPLDLRKLIF